METIKNILTAILKWLGSIPSDKLLHLIAGAVIAAFFALVIPYTAEICVLFAAIAGTWPIQWPEVSSFKFSRGYETTFETHRIEADLYHRLALHRRAKGLRHHRRCRARPEQKRAVRQWRKESVCRNRYPLRDIRHHAESPIPEV